MISNKKLKKVLISIIAVLTLLAVCFLTTKIIYDNIFSRYDCKASVSSDSLKGIIDYRKNFRYKCEKISLSGYLYESNSEAKKDTLIVLAPGFNACSDSYLWQIKELNDYGWSVFAFDTTGCCSSEGKSSVGFPQEIIDLKATLDFIENNNRFDYKNIALLGHSRGGYAVCCALACEYNISAVVSVSGINSAMDGIIGSSKQYVGNFAYANYGFLWLYQTMLFGDDIVNLRADEILSNTDTPVLIIHGENDKTYPTDKFSIISKRDKINNDKIEYFICSSPENSGHTDLLFEDDGTADDRLIMTIDNFLRKSIK